jgi:WD40 repeat protein
MDIEHNSNHYVLSQVLFDHKKAVRCLAIQDNMLFSGAVDNKMHLYIREDAASKWALKHTYEFFGGWVLSIAFIPGGEYIVVGCQDKKIYLCSTEDPAHAHNTFEGHEGAVNCVRANEDKIFSGSWDATAKIWDLDSSDIIASLDRHSHAVTVCPIGKSE